MRIRKGDMVVVSTGDDSSKTPRRVLRIVDGGKRVVVEGVNRVYKHVRKGHPKSPQGGRLSVEMPIDASNVLVHCPKCNRGVRVASKTEPSGTRVRGCRKCGTTLATSK